MSHCETNSHYGIKGVYLTIVAIYLTEEHFMAMLSTERGVALPVVIAAIFDFTSKVQEPLIFF